MKCDYCKEEFTKNSVYVICKINTKKHHFCDEDCKRCYEEEHDYFESDVEDFDT